MGEVNAIAPLDSSELSPSTNYAAVSFSSPACLTDDGDPRDRETGRGRKKRAAAKLVAGGSSGEASAATAFTSPVRIYWTHLLKR